MSARQVRKSRLSGTGLFLVIGVSGLVCLGIVAMSRLFSTSHTLDRAARGVGGAVVEEGALSAIEIGLWNFQTQINSPTSTLFKKVRSAFIACKKCSIDCAYECFPKDLKTTVPSLTIENFCASVEVPEMEETGHLGPQLLNFSTTVSMKIGKRTVRRSATATYKLGLSHVSQPKPYDQATMAIASAGAYDQLLPSIAKLLDIAEEYNRMVVRFNAFVEYLNTFPHGKGTERSDLLPFYFSVGFTPDTTEKERVAIDRIYRAEPWRMREWERLTENGSRRDEGLEWRNRRLLDRLPEGQIPFNFSREMTFVYPHRLEQVVHNRVLRETPGIDSVTLCLESECQLAEYDLNAILADTVWPSWDNLNKAAEFIKELNKEWYDRANRDLLTNDIQDEREIREFVNGMRELMTNIHDNIGNCILALNSFIRFVLGKTLAPFNGPPAMGLANYVPQGYHINQRTPKEDLDELVKEYGGVSGHVFIAPTGGGCLAQLSEEELEKLAECGHPCLDQVDIALPSYRGSTVMSAFRPTRLKQITVAESQSDLLILGLQATTLTNSRVEAGVCCASAMFEGSPRIKGNFVLGSLPFIKYPERKERLSGFVQYDERIFSGFFMIPELEGASEDWVIMQNYVVGVCPRGYERQVERR